MKRRRKRRRGRSTTLSVDILVLFDWQQKRVNCQSLFHECLFFLIFSPCPPWWLCFLCSSFLLCQLYICHSFYPHSKSQLLSHTFAHCPSPSICFLRLSPLTLPDTFFPSRPLIHPSSYQPSLLSPFSLFCFLKVWKASDTLAAANPHLASLSTPLQDVLETPYCPETLPLPPQPITSSLLRTASPHTITLCPLMSINTLFPHEHF